MQKSELIAHQMNQIEAYRSSGQTAAEWCNENNVSISNLRYWITRVNRRKASLDSSFVAFTPTVSGQSGITVYINNYGLELNSGFDPALFKEIVLILKTL